MNKSHRDLANAAMGLSALLLLALGRGWGPEESPAATGKLPLRLAYFPNLTHAPALVGVGEGRYERELPKYAISSRVVNAGPEAMEALLAGEVDLAFVGPSPAINTFVKSKGEALRIIAGACDGGASLVARGDVPIASVRDLDGRTVAVPQIGGTQDVSLRHFLAANGLRSRERGGTVSILPIANPDILTLFKRRQIDAAWVPEPWASRLRDEAGGKTAVDERTLWPEGRFTTTVLVARRAFAEAHPDAVRAFVSAHAATVAWMNGHEKEAQSVANRELKRLAGKPLRPSVLTEAWSHLTFTTDPNPTSIAAFAQAARNAGYLKDRRTDLTMLVDTRSWVADRTQVAR
jgi:NitT/TauT family transport system substrate-binding protein